MNETDSEMSIYSIGSPVYWKNVNGLSAPLRLNSQGEVSCLGYINEDTGKVQCRTGNDVNAIITERKDTDYSELACGDHHMSLYGGSGYGDYNHWCSGGMRSLSKRDVDKYSFEGRKTCGDNAIKEVDLPRKQMSGYCNQRMNKKAGTRDSKEVCMDWCHSDNNCTAISYNTQNNYCRLHSTQNCQNMTVNMLQNTGVQQFTTYFKGDYRREQCKDHCDDDLNCSYFSLDDDKCKMYSLDTCTRVDSSGNELYKLNETARLNKNIDRLLRLNEELTESSNNLNETLDSKTKELENTRDDLVDKSEFLNVAISNLKQTQENQSTSNADLKAAADKILELNGELKSIETEIKTTNTQINNTKGDIETATTSINTANGNLSFLDGIIENFNKFIDDFF